MLTDQRQHRPQSQINTRRPINIMLATAFLFGLFWAEAADADDAVTTTLKAASFYVLGPGDSTETARKLAVFRAKREAAGKAADQFARNKLIQFENGDRDELVALVAESINHTLLSEKWRKQQLQKAFLVKLKAVAHLSDFIEAQLVILSLARKYTKKNFRDEMEPPLPEFSRPGLSLANAFWLIRKDEPRMAILHLDGLIRQYPNWGEPYEVKAAALSLQHEPGLRREVLRRACELGSTSACTELK